MRIESISATEFARNMAGIIDQVRYTGESVAITKGTRTMVMLVPPAPAGLPIDELATLIENAPKLGALGSHMAQDLKKIRSSSQQKLENPWD